MNTFGDLFKVTIYGESHGKGVGIIIDGCPAGIKLDGTKFGRDLLRRKAGDVGTTSRIETDSAEILSGIVEEVTTGAPINIFFANENTRSKDYDKLRSIPRPGHADFVAHKKYDGYNDIKGGGHFSGRLTLGIVAAGVIAKQILKGSIITAHLTEIGGITTKEANLEYIDIMLQSMAYRGDSVGGIVQCSCYNLPVGLGEPFFDSVESKLSHMIFSIPGIKGIEFGMGFEMAKKRGSEVNDTLIDTSGKTLTNFSGGINGGISNGNEILFKVAIKPTSSIAMPQQTINLETKEMEELKIEGRHDACFAKRAVVVIENATAIVLADLMLKLKAYRPELLK